MRQADRTGNCCVGRTCLCYQQRAQCGANCPCKCRALGTDAADGGAMCFLGFDFHSRVVWCGVCSPRHLPESTDAKGRRRAVLLGSRHKQAAQPVLRRPARQVRPVCTPSRRPVTHHLYFDLLERCPIPTTSPDHRNDRHLHRNRPAEGTRSRACCTLWAMLFFLLTPCCMYLSPISLNCPNWGTTTSCTVTRTPKKI